MAGGAGLHRTTGAVGLAERLRGMTSLVPPAANDPFASSGVLASGRVAARRRAEARPAFDVTEARARIADFASGGYAPGSLTDLMSYLAERFLRLESRRGANGQWKNYIVDLRTKGALLAAEVDRRLSTVGIARMFGTSLDAEAEMRRRRLQQTPEMVDARNLRNELRAMFQGHGLVPDDDWESFDVTVNTTFGGRTAMVQGDELWVGREIARAGEDPEENLRLMRRMRDEGRACLWPARTVEDARAGRLIRGMPIVLRAGAVRTRMIDPERLSLESLTRKFGESYYDYYDRKPRRPAGLALPGSEASSANVVSMSLFRKRPAAQPRPAEAPVRRIDIAPEAAVDRFSVRHELGRGGGERLVVRDRWDNVERQLGDTDLPAGRYVKEDGFGMPSGYLLVAADGGYSHQDNEGRMHNQYGPAVVPVTGEPTFALEGEILTEREFNGRHAPAAGARRPAGVAPIAAMRSPAPAPGLRPGR